MGSFVVRRLLILVPVLIGSVTLLFMLFFVAPGDPVTLLAGGSRNIPEPTRNAIEERYGLNDPLPQQYVDYLGRLVTWDLGESYKTREDVNSILGRTLPASLRLATAALLIETLVGISAGVLSAVKRYSFVDSLTTIATALASAVPVFVLGYLLQLTFGVYAHDHGWPEWAQLPVQGIGPNEWWLFVFPTLEQLPYLVLPALTLASVSTAVIARFTRSTMLEVLGNDYMRTARAKGLSEGQVVRRHGLRNGMIPVVTLIGVDFGVLIGSAIVTETVFNWPGIGSEVAEAVTRRDAPVVLGLTLVMVVAYVLINLVVDLSYAFFDPRIRQGRGSER